jgi:hypothetical protein
MTRLKYDHEKLTFDLDRQYKRNKIAYLSIFGVGFIALITMAVMWLGDDSRTSFENEVHAFDVYTGEEPFSVQRFREYLDEAGVRFPDVVFAQAFIESNFKSPIFKEGNNALGMKLARARNTTAIGEIRGHAAYRSWKACIQDYALMQAAFARKIKTEEQYLKYIGEVYATDLNYETKVREKLKNIRKNQE